MNLRKILKIFVEYQNIYKVTFLEYVKPGYPVLFSIKYPNRPETGKKNRTNFHYQFQSCVYEKKSIIQIFSSINNSRLVFLRILIACLQLVRHLISSFGVNDGKAN